MKFEFEGLDEFMSALDKASNGGFLKELATWLDAMGMEFLELVQAEIIRTKTVDTRNLLNSFQKGDKENAWTMTNGNMTLDVGSNLNYASYANEGHFAIDINSGKDRRWIPGRWKGSRFEYDPNERESGMMLGQQWVSGSHYWDDALAIYDRIFEKGLDRLLQSWMSATF